MNVSEIIRTIAYAMSEEGENTEYDRACTEIAGEILGLDHEEDMRYAVQGLLQHLKAY